MDRGNVDKCISFVAKFPLCVSYVISILVFCMGFINSYLAYVYGPFCLGYTMFFAYDSAALLIFLLYCAYMCRETQFKKK